MSDFIGLVNSTPLPNLLIILGCALVFLAFVGKFGTYVELPPERQRLGGIVGVILVLTGTSLATLPQLTDAKNQNGDNSRPASDESTGIDEDAYEKKHNIENQYEDKKEEKALPYNVRLENLHPNNDLLPINVKSNWVKSKLERYNIDDMIRYGGDNEQSFSILRGSEPKGISWQYSLIMCTVASYNRVVIIAYSIDSVEKTKKYFQLWKDSHRANIDEHIYKEYDTILGDGYITNYYDKCQTFSSPELRTILHTRWLRRRNLILGVRLEADYNKIDFVRAEKVSQQIMTHMVTRLE